MDAQSRRGRKPGGINNLRPVTADKYQCGSCGADQPEGKDKRSRCPKCGGHAWETVPGHPPAQVQES